MAYGRAIVIGSEPDEDTKWQYISLLFGVIAVSCALSMSLIIIRGPHRKKEHTHFCNSTNLMIDISEASEPGIFHDLTKIELQNIQEYLYSDRAKDLNLIRQDSLKSSSIFVVDLLPSNKSAVLNYLDKQGPKPIRKARVIIFRGDLSPPVVEDYIIQPLPNPTQHQLFAPSSRTNDVPFANRPLGALELKEVSRILATLDNTLSGVFTESYDATITHCGNKCLTFLPHVLPTSINQTNTRKLWMEARHDVPYFNIHPLDFTVLINMDGSDSQKFFIEKLSYNGQTFTTADELKYQYTRGFINKTKVVFPNEDLNLFSTSQSKGEQSKSSKRPPYLIEPDGKRYTIKHRHVEYFDWKLDVRMSSITGPQIYNIVYRNKRIVYEMGLQEIAVSYSYPIRLTDHVDIGALLGTHSKILIPGADCPHTATYIPVTFLGDAMDAPQTIDRAMCVFEQNTGLPLKRHLSYSVEEGGFYGGVMDHVLTIRTILAIGNHDYIFDFIFHQNGAIEVRAVVTGYVYTTFYAQHEQKNGIRLNENTLGILHHHMFNFKVDLDINGTSNRYETLDFLTEDANNCKWTGIDNDTYNQIYFHRNTVKTELEAAYQFNFDAPKYHIFHNNAKQTQYKIPKAYRVQMDGISKQTLNPDQGSENSIKWARYQLAVTQYKDGEFSSSSPYNQFSRELPVVDFQKYIEDNETIIDKDLVIWLTMGMYQLPHTEDLSVTPTSGAHLSFALLPYNYFTVDPSVHNPDSVTVFHKDQAKPEDGVIYREYINSPQDPCVSEADVQSVYDSNPDLVLESQKKTGHIIT